MKYGLYGAVLAGVVGGSVAWSSVDKTVTLVVDGHSRHVHTTASRVGEVLKAGGYHVASHDLVAPPAQSSVHNGDTVVYKRGRLLHLDVNGVDKDVWTTAPTVAAALDQLGFSTADFSSVSRSRRLPLTPTDITVRTPKLVTVVHDGTDETVTTLAATAAQLLTDLGVAPDESDRVSVPLSSAITNGETIVVQRVVRKTVRRKARVPFNTVKKKDSSLLAGHTRVVTRGVDGVADVTYSVVYLDGKVIGKTQLKKVVLTKPTTQVEAVGTMKVPTVPIAVSPGSAQAIAKAMLADRGWGDDQFSCLVQLWNNESGWRVHASNPSGAYGIPQALPGSKMSTYGADWRDSAKTQITWGLAYISSRYDTPCGAWSFWDNHHWY